MAEFVIKTYDTKIHNIYLKGEVDEEMWQSLVDKINEIKEEIKPKTTKKVTKTTKKSTSKKTTKKVGDK